MDVSDQLHASAALTLWKSLHKDTYYVEHNIVFVNLIFV